MASDLAQTVARSEQKAELVRGVLSVSTYRFRTTALPAELASPKETTPMLHLSHAKPCATRLVVRARISLRARGPAAVAVALAAMAAPHGGCAAPPTDDLPVGAARPRELLRNVASWRLTTSPEAEGTTAFEGRDAKGRTVFRATLRAVPDVGRAFITELPIACGVVGDEENVLDRVVRVATDDRCYDLFRELARDMPAGSVLASNVTSTSSASAISGSVGIRAVPGGQGGSSVSAACSADLAKALLAQTSSTGAVAIPASCSGQITSTTSERAQRLWYGAKPLAEAESGGASVHTCSDKPLCARYQASDGKVLLDMCDAKDGVKWGVIRGAYFAQVAKSNGKEVVSCISATPTGVSVEECNFNDDTTSGSAWIREEIAMDSDIAGNVLSTSGRAPADQKATSFKSRSTGKCLVADGYYLSQKLSMVDCSDAKATQRWRFGSLAALDLTASSTGQVRRNQVRPLYATFRMTCDPHPTGSAPYPSAADVGPDSNVNMDEDRNFFMYDNSRLKGMKMHPLAMCGSYFSKITGADENHAVGSCVLLFHPKTQTSRVAMITDKLDASGQGCESVTYHHIDMHAADVATFEGANAIKFQSSSAFSGRLGVGGDAYWAFVTCPEQKMTLAYDCGDGSGAACKSFLKVQVRGNAKPIESVSLKLKKSGGSTFEAVTGKLENGTLVVSAPFDTAGATAEVTWTYVDGTAGTGFATIGAADTARLFPACTAGESVTIGSSTYQNSARQAGAWMTSEVPMVATEGGNDTVFSGVNGSDETTATERVAADCDK